MLQFYCEKTPKRWYRNLHFKPMCSFIIVIASVCIISCASKPILRPLEVIQKDGHSLSPEKAAHCLESLKQTLSENKQVKVETNFSGDPSEEKKSEIKKSLETFLRWGLAAEGLEITNKESNVMLRFELEFNAEGYNYTTFGYCLTSFNYKGNITLQGPSGCSFIRNIYIDGPGVPHTIHSCNNNKENVPFHITDTTLFNFFQSLFGPFNIIKQQYFSGSITSPSSYLISHYAPKKLLGIVNEALLLKDSILKEGAVDVIKNAANDYNYRKQMRFHENELDTFIRRSFATNNHKIIERTLYIMRRLNYYPDKKANY